MADSQIQQILMKLQNMFQPSPASTMNNAGTSDAYLRYLIDMNTQGQQPLQFAHWQKMMQQQGQPQGLLGGQ